MNRNIILIALSFFVSQIALSQSSDQNYTAERVMLDESGNASIASIQYYNGLGYPTLSVSNVGGNGETSYSLTTYDALGREECKYLPVAIGNTVNYKTPYEVIKAHEDETAYSKNNYDALNRVTSVELPGKEWHDYDKRNKTVYSANTDDDKVLHYVANPDGNFSLVKPDDKTNPYKFYPVGTLTKEVSKDADDKTVVTFKDFLGNVILQRTVLDGKNDLDTYYVYDAIGQLSYVLQPLYQKNGKKAITAYEYRYDDRGRLVKKFLPGGGCIQYWYDDADRLIGMQDAMMKKKGLYRFTLYDELGRLVVQGVSDFIDIPSGEKSVAKFTSNVLGSFCNTGYQLSYNPISKANTKKIEIINYYDNYAFSKTRNASYFVGFSDTTRVPQTGLLTGNLTLCSNGEFLSQLMIYDNKGNLVKKNSREIGGHIVKTKNSYTFTNNVASSECKVEVNDDEFFTANQTFTYNEYNDKKKESIITISHANSNGTTKMVYSYDDLGRLSSISRPSSSVSYDYELHGWLKKITTNSFKEELFYADCPNKVYNCYNGNIGTMRWSNSNYEQVRGYKFVYDNANRLTEAIYGERTDLNNKKNRYNEVLEYDENGNITSLQRRGLKQDGEYGKIDNLNLSYIGNQLSSVEEDAKDYDYEGSFEYKRVNGSQYMYNENGSLIADKSRKIAYITYDFNNNPTQIYFVDGHMTKYVYSAFGQKVRTIHYVAVKNLEGRNKIGELPTELTNAETLRITTTDYLLDGRLVLKENELDKYLFDGGYCQMQVSRQTAGPKSFSWFEDEDGNFISLGGNSMSSGQVTTEFAFNYYNQDHLGNNREVVDASGTVTQVTNYYPFGAPYADATAIKGAAIQPYKYNGKELDLMHGLNTYDYGARQHDPILARWDRIDPLCEKYYSTSPYAYCENDPVNTVDPDGRSGWKVLLKAVYKIGKSAVKNGGKSLTNAATYADAFNDVVEDTKTLFDSNASTWDRVEAGVSLLSEVASPISIKDAKFIGKTTKGLGHKIEPNNGIAKPHGGKEHNKAIDNFIKELRENDQNVNIRKNQCQVDAKGNKVGNNRPDIQYDDKNGVHHNIEFDHSQKQSERHQEKIEQNDPNAINDFFLLLNSPKK